jgi:hypothetical protein
MKDAFGVERISKAKGKVAMKAAALPKAPKSVHKPKGKPAKDKKFDWSGISRNKYALGAAGATAATGAGALGYMAYSDNKR